MSKKLFFILLIFFSCGVLKAQEFADLSPADVPMMDNNWSLLATKKYKEVSKDKFVPIFPAPLKAMNNKIFTLSGYMVAMKIGTTHTTFMLAVVPIAQCQFCGINGIPDMVEIHMQKAIPFQSEPITIIGNLMLTTAENTAAIHIMNGKIYK